MLATAVLALCWLFAVQEPTPATVPAAESDPEANTLPHSPHDRVIALALSAVDPALEGHGSSQRIDYVAEFSGTLHVWTKVDETFDTFLRVEDEAGKLLGENDESGGKPTPYVGLTVEPGTVLAIVVAGSKAGESGELEVHLLTAPESETTRSEALRAQQDLAEIKSLRERGDLANARVRAVVAIEHLEKIEGGAHSELVAQQFWQAGFEAEALGLIPATEMARRRALAHYSRTLSPDHPYLQAARLNLGATLKARGDFASARTLFEQVREVFSRTLPADHPYLQTASINLAIAMTLMGEPAPARDLLEPVLEVFSRTLPADDPSFQAARLNLAVAMHAQGDLVAARPLFQQVVDVGERTLPADHSELQRARQGLAATLKGLGDIAGALALFEQVLEVWSRTMPEDHQDLQGALLNVAGTRYSLGDIAGARAVFEQVVEVGERNLPDDHVYLLEARLNLASTMEDLGDLAGARALFEEVLEACLRTLPDDHPMLRMARGNLAASLKAQGDLEGAQELEEQVLEVSSRSLPDDHPDLQMARRNLAATMYAQGDHIGAHATLEQVLEVLSRTLPPGHPDLEKARANVASASMALGNFADAREQLEQVLEACSRTLPEHHPDLQWLRQNLAVAIACGRTSEDEGEEGRAKFVELTGEFTRSIAHVAREALLSGSSREAEERCANLSDDLGRALSFAEGLGVFGRDEELERLAFLSSESTRGATSTSARLARRAAAHPRYTELRDEIRQASADLARLSHGAATADGFDRARSRRDDAERELVGIAKEMLGEGTGALDLDLAAISARLAESDAVVGYRRYPRYRLEKGQLLTMESLCAFVLRSGEQLDRIELGAIEPIAAAVQDWREAIGVARGTRGLSSESSGSASGASHLHELSVALRRLVLDPLFPALEGAECVIVALDDVLNLVPLDALPAADAPMTNALPALLGDRLRIETRATLSELLVEYEPLTGGAELVAIGGVDYEARTEGRVGTTATSLLLSAAEVRELVASRAGILRGGAWSSGFAELSGTSAEVQGIAKSLRDGFGERAALELLEGARATRERFVALAPGARFLHVATHGWFAPESIRSILDAEPLDGKDLRLDAEERVKGMAPMLLCGIALAGANLPDDELGRAPGLMTAEELSTLDLRNCELAVLSACDTNVGERRGGQGVASLQRALHMAGARTVITSLWKVPDEATAELMLDFYRRIWVLNEPKHEALWAAKRKLRDAVDERGEPKYTTRDWAAWMLTGEQD